MEDLPAIISYFTENQTKKLILHCGLKLWNLLPFLQEEAKLGSVSGYYLFCLQCLTHLLYYYKILAHLQCSDISILGQWLRKCSFGKIYECVAPASKYYPLWILVYVLVWQKYSPLETFIQNKIQRMKSRLK